MAIDTTSTSNIAMTFTYTATATAHTILSAMEICEPHAAKRMVNETLEITFKPHVDRIQFKLIEKQIEDVSDG